MVCWRLWDTVGAQDNKRVNIYAKWQETKFIMILTIHFITDVTENWNHFFGNINIFFRDVERKCRTRFFAAEEYIVVLANSDLIIFY